MKNEGERMAVLEQKVTDLGVRFTDMAIDIKDIKAALTPVTDFERRLLRLEKSSNLWKWLAPSLAAVLSSIMTFLIIQYLSHLG